MTHGGEILPFAAAQCDITLTCLPFFTAESQKKNFFSLTRQIISCNPQLCKELCIFPYQQVYLFKRCISMFVSFLNQPEELVKMTIWTHCICIVWERKRGGGEIVNLSFFFFFSLGLLIGVLSSLASCRRPCRSRLPQCPQGPASPLG